MTTVCETPNEVSLGFCMVFQKASDGTFTVDISTKKMVSPSRLLIPVTKIILEDLTYVPFVVDETDKVLIDEDFLESLNLSLEDIIIVRKPQTNEVEISTLFKLGENDPRVFRENPDTGATFLAEQCSKALDLFNSSAKSNEETKESDTPTKG